jgi:hypothetical protein
MSDRQAENEQRVTPLELFFDLVVVFAITQVTGFLSRFPTWGGLLRGMLLLGAPWWAWSAYAWLTNTLDPEEGAVRLAVLAVLAAIAAMLVVSLAAPGAFGRDSVTFGVAYFIVRALRLVLYAIAGRGDRDLLRAVLRIVPSATVGPALLVIAGFLKGPGQLALWGAALAIDYVGAAAGHMRGWRVSPAHFVERFGLVIIIALGESVVAIGVGAAGLTLDARLIAAALLGITVVACLWWSYFDWVVYLVQASLAEATGARRAALAGKGGARPRGPRHRCGYLCVADRLRGHPAPGGPRLDPRPAGRVHDGGGLTCGRESGGAPSSKNVSFPRPGKETPWRCSPRSRPPKARTSGSPAMCGSTPSLRARSRLASASAPSTSRRVHAPSGTPMRSAKPCTSPRVQDLCSRAAATSSPSVPATSSTHQRTSGTGTELHPTTS